MSRRLPAGAGHAAQSPLEDAERLLRFLQESRRTLEHQLQLLKQSAKGSGTRAGQSSEVLLHQILEASEEELGVLEAQAQAWVGFLASLAAGEPEAAALATLQARMAEVEAEQARACRAVGPDTGSDGLDLSRAEGPDGR